MQRRTLDVSGIFDGARLVVLGGTGFLGKMFWSMLLDRYPQIGRVFLVVRSKNGMTPEERFWSVVAASESVAPIRRSLGDGFEVFLRDKVVPIDGDMGRLLCGISPELVVQLKGTIDAVVNVAGVVDFNPPLDEALKANAFGAQNLVALAQALGGAPIMHTSTCYVAGTRQGLIREEHPCAVPFPRAEELGAELWDPDREIAECLDLVAQAEHRCDDAFRQSEFAERVRKNLLSRGEPVRGQPYDLELLRVKRKFISERLVDAGLDRATHWGWPNIYTYTKAIGEQVIARSGLPFAICRPACCESTVAYPQPAYNEGVNTSAMHAYLIMKGEPQILGKHVPLDFIPTDYVVAGMILALAELSEGSAKPVYQFGAADVNPCTVQRFGELMGLYKRQHYRRKGSGNALWNAIQARYEPVFVDRKRFDALGAPAIARITRGLASFVRTAAPGLGAAAGALDRAANREGRIAEIQEVFAPFTTTRIGPFDCSNTRAAYARLANEDKVKLPWAPESIDWADWMMNIHMPAMEARIIPEMDRRLKKAPRPLASYPTLVALVDEMAERHDLGLALQRMTDDGFTRTTFRDVKVRAWSTAARLAALGVKKGDRIALAAHNDPDWPIAYFGILRAGGTAVPVDPTLDAAAWGRILRESGARVVIWNGTVAQREQVAAAHPGLVQLELRAATERDGEPSPPEVAIEPGDVASIIFGSGTTGKPIGVTFTHANFTSLVAALAPIFPLSQGDAVLSVVPLHHTLEFTCGLLLPLSRGARVVYLGELSGERLANGLRTSRATAMVGVPALWQLLERRILVQVDAHGRLARAAFDVAAEANRWLANVGVDVGSVLFGGVHASVGGQMKWLISGGAALPGDTRRFFESIGLRLTQGYGLTEAAPILTVVRPGHPSQPGVGAPKDVVVSPTGESDYPEDIENRPGALPLIAELAAVGIEEQGGEKLACIAVPAGANGVGHSGGPASSARKAPLALPEPVRHLGRALVGKAQDIFYGDVMKPRVSGRSYIPHNRNVIVVANHASHLDMGLVRHALGKYGEDVVSLAAQDGFFESGITRAFFENFTNSKGLDPNASLQQAARQAGEVVEGGKTLLVFPEETRSDAAEIGEFKPLVGHLTLKHGVDILPLFLGGTRAAMPRGAKLPARRDIDARIGSPLRVSDLRRMTEGMSSSDAAREVAQIARAAVIALSEGKVLDVQSARRLGDLSPAGPHPLVKLFGELEAKFRAGEVQTAVSYYVSLGSDDMAKWTVRVDAKGCDVRPGKPEGGKADCVLKTSPELFAKIVRESYVPSAADFISGAIRSNDLALLMTFQRVFQLDTQA
jgi:long-chain acyl-CoA synthetase